MSGLDMWQVSDLNNQEKLRYENIIDMGLTYSAMIRNFQEGSKRKLAKQLAEDVMEKVFNVTSEAEFVNVHSAFSTWGTENIHLAERKRNGEIVKQSVLASYGQIAKTLDVTLKVAIYYCHMPECAQSKRLCQWINAAVDTNMMKELQMNYPDKIKQWPRKVEDVDRNAYFKIQELVREAIAKWHDGLITPVQYDDIHWKMSREKSRQLLRK